MDRTDFMNIVYDLLKDDPDNNRANEIIEAADEYAESMKPKWTPVTTDPPKKEETYLVLLDDGGVCECRWTDGDYLFGKPTGVWRWNFIDLPKYGKVVAWMPEPWKEEKRDDR